ncbi:hypothetical protein CA13_31630 [Planctomycetes bacterium CA13]|uniref:Uncharacterized protein n=1 Tax=Novipirellula herctigrandis TaxID=2527986 RepID=A0A5C5Z3E5_9BACT|nr:hypothetical protein CA13_31630 [Planctomycetes bacterium CA13]
MAILLIPLAIVALGWAAFAAHGSLQRRGASRGWFAAFFALMAAGACTGVYFGFFFDYLAAPTVRVYSFPVPAAFHILESYDDSTQRWVDFITPAPILFAGSNVIIFSCAMVLPLWLVSAFWRFPSA